MSLTVLWCDEFFRLDPFEGAALDGEKQAPDAPPVRVSAVRGAVASFQLLVGPVGAGREALVGPGGLTGPSEARIASTQYDVFVEWYHQLEGKWFPDALVPQDLVGGSTPALRKQMGLPAAAKFAGFWVDLHVPADARPGVYSGSIAVRSGSEVLSVPVVLDVAAAKLPADPTLDISMNNYVDSISSAYADVKGDPRRFYSEKYRRIERGVFRCCHDHRSFLHYLPYTHAGYVHGDFAPPVAGEGPKKRVTDWSNFDRHFGPYFDGSAFKGTRRGAVPTKHWWMPLNVAWPADFLKFGSPGFDAEWRAVGSQIVDHFRKKGWTGTEFDLFHNQKQRFRFVPWDLEECRFLPDNDVHRYLRRLWEGVYDWKSARPVKFNYTLAPTWTYGIDIKTDLVEFTDIFITGTSGPRWWPEQTAKIRKQGCRVWACTHSGDILNGPRAAAFTPLAMWMRGIDGCMPSWLSMAGWGSGAWHQVPNRGANTYVYSGVELGSEETFPSLRFKVLRNAVQTVDLLETAAKKKGRAAVQAAAGKVIGFATRDWFQKPPAYVEKKLPKDWVDADFATEEPPSVGWDKISSNAWRGLNAVAARLAGGR